MRNWGRQPDARTRKQFTLLRIGIIALFVASSLDASAQKSSAISDMVRLDRALIPAVLTIEGLGSYDDIYHAISNLASAWKTFQKEQEPQAEIDALWAADLLRIEDGIGRAYALASESSKEWEIYGLLAEIRHKLSTHRERNDVLYFPDTLVDFILRFTEFGALMRVEGLGESQERMSDLSKAWNNVNEFRLDKLVYGLDYYRMGEFRAYREAVTTSLESLRDAINEKGSAAATTEIETIETNLTALYKLFGNFED